MTPIQDIQQAIYRLSPVERYTLALWTLESAGSGDRFAELAPACNTAPEIPLLSVHDYLELEMNAATGHEYLAGEIFAMCGASAAHNLVACVNEGLEKYFLRNPKVIVEVLSPSTEGTDRREKFMNYRRIPTLEEYILIAQDTPEVTIHRRSTEWKPTVLTALEAIGEIQSLELSLPLAQVYDGAL